MTKREYEQLTKAMRLLMEDEPIDDEDAKTFEGGFLAAMDMLDEMRIAHMKMLKRINNGKE